jgi:hypothetical protein
MLKQAITILLTIVFCFLAFNGRSDARIWEDSLAMTIEESTDTSIVIKWIFNHGDSLVSYGFPYDTWQYPSFIVPENCSLSYAVVDSHSVTLPWTQTGGSKTAEIDEEENTIMSEAGRRIASMVIEGPFKQRDYYIGVYGVYYFRQSGPDSMTFYDTLKVRISFNGGSGINPPDTVVDEFDRLYKQRYINYDRIRSQNPPVLIPGELLIITYDSFYNDLNDFADWKRQRGIKTTIAKVSADVGGNDTTKIMDYISGFYDTTNLTWVLLVGDYQQVICPYFYRHDQYGDHNLPCDPEYTLIDGDDDYLDIFIGRFSSEQSSHVQTQVERSLTYGKTPIGGDWYHKAFFVGEFMEGSWICYRNRDSLLNHAYTQVDTNFSYPYDSITIPLNDGRGFLSYYGHGGPASFQSPTSYYYGDVNNLTNTNKLPFIISGGCNNGIFHDGTCFGEYWLRATDSAGDPTGAIGCFMCADICSSTMPGRIAFTRMLAREEMHSMGGLFQGGISKCVDCFIVKDFIYPGLIYYRMTVFGDPSLWLRTDTPDTMSVSHDSLDACSDNSLSVTVNGIEGAQCALTSNYNIYGVGFTNSSGQATIDFWDDLPTDQDIILTVTGFNQIPYIDTVWEGTDIDNDGVGNSCDNCPDTANADQADGDGDGVGNVCDNCPDTANANQTDTDSDGVGDVCDNCVNAANTNQEDFDTDGVGDSCDTCTDQDGDGYGDPDFPENTCDDDNCPKVANADQADEDSDGWGDACSGCGDVNNDGVVSVLDITYLQNYIYYSGPAPNVMRSADVNCDCAINILDISYLIAYIYSSGPAPECPDDWDDCVPCE